MQVPREATGCAALRVDLCIGGLGAVLVRQLPSYEGTAPAIAPPIRPRDRASATQQAGNVLKRNSLSSSPPSGAWRDGSSAVPLVVMAARCKYDARAAPSPRKREIHRVGPEFASWPSSLTENFYYI